MSTHPTRGRNPRASADAGPRPTSAATGRARPRILHLAASGLLLAAVLAGCAEAQPEPQSPVRVVSLESSTLSVEPGQRMTLSWVTENAARTHASAAARPVEAGEGDGREDDLGGGVELALRHVEPPGDAVRRDLDEPPCGSDGAGDCLSAAVQSPSRVQEKRSGPRG
jgi:hypothetical protein